MSRFFAALFVLALFVGCEEKKADKPADKPAAPADGGADKPADDSAAPAPMGEESK